MIRLQAGPNGAVFDPEVGNIPDLWFGPLMPLHRAPWYGTVDGMPGLPRVEQRLAGDFLCMPFGTSDLVDGPHHGAPSNGTWEVTDSAPHRVRLRLKATAMGATVEKELRLASRAPLLYQTHVITGGKGHATLAHHPMVRMAAGGRMAFSPKRAILTPEAALDGGATIFPGGLRTTDPADPRLDLTRYPSKTGEDFVTLVEAEGSRLGWTAVTRMAENDVVFILKDPQVLPVTMLWFSNYGRAAPPWSGRHGGVLGIEDGIAAGSAGHRAALAENPIKAEGVPTSLELGPEARHEIRHVIGAIPKPEGWSTVTRIRRQAGQLVITGDDGSSVGVDFAAGFL